MYLIVVGAEPEGIHLIDMAVKGGHQVSLVESDPSKARQVLKNHDIRVFNGSGSDEQILNEADASKADAIVATSQDDATNLMVMMLAREHGVENLISLVREPHHQKLFKQIGVNVLTDPASIIAQQLYQMFSNPESEA